MSAVDIYVGFKNHLKDKMNTLDPKIKEEGERRLSICNTCPKRLAMNCSVCGCYLPAKVLSDSDCPIGKWDK